MKCWLDSAEYVSWIAFPWMGGLGDMAMEFWEHSYDRYTFKESWENQRTKSAIRARMKWWDPTDRSGTVVREDNTHNHPRARFSDSVPNASDDDKFAPVSAR
jgi:hypothetical protein